MSSIIRHLLAASVALACGCRDKESDAPPPPSSGGSAASSAVEHDSGLMPRPSDDEDAGGGDASTPDDSGVLAIECTDVPVAQIPAGELPEGTKASTTAPADFAVSRLVANWQGGCSAPVFRIELSNGECPDGRGHALTFLIDAEALRDGDLRLGLNTIAPEPNETGVSIRYRRPDPLEPQGEWGTCTGASGTLDLVGDAPSVERLRPLQGTFSLDLTACGDGGVDPLTVAGTFDVIMRRGLEDVCPTM